MTNLIPIDTVPKTGEWVWLFGRLYDEPHGHLGFWSENDWYESEASSHSLTGFGWQPTHWMPYVTPWPEKTG